MWDPATYLRYGDERGRPFHELLARVAADRPRVVVDLGCGPGNLTVTLADRWPDATVVGLDSSPEMIDKAAALDTRVTFTVADISGWVPDPRTDVVVSNAALQWVPGHQALLAHWVDQLPAGAWLAVQLPGNHESPAHRAIRAVADQPRWRDTVGPLVRREPVLDPGGYIELLTGMGCVVDAWETTYVHQLPAGDDVEHPVLSWLEGTGLRPVRAALADGSDWPAFRCDLRQRLVEAYPIRSGRVLFPFRRVFFVARVNPAQPGFA